MRRIIDGLAYDTDKAELVHKWHDSYPANDFHAVEESLYKTPADRWFIYYVGGALSQYGGALSQYAERVDSNTGSRGSGFSRRTMPASGWNRMPRPMSTSSISRRNAWQHQHQRTP